jgi:peptide/nickel transport system permease protein
MDGNHALKLGLFLLSIMILIAIFAPCLETYGPKVLSDDVLVAPCSAHWLGTDDLGRDVYSMLIEGSRVSLKVGIIAAMITAVIGVIFGAVAGYFGGLADKIMNEIINIFMMLPTFFLVLIIVALFGSSMLNVMIVIGLTSWPSNARLMRAQAMSLRERTFVRSAEAIGESRSSIIFRYIIPNGIFPVIANTTMNIGGAILTEASLSFLGLGDPNVVSWGQMINQGRGYIVNGWWVAAFAGLAILLVVLIFYLIGDGISAQMNPKTRRR